MTNKEAVMILESIQPSCGDKYCFSESERYEAIDMAISALKIQTNAEEVTSPLLTEKWKSKHRRIEP